MATTQTPPAASGTTENQPAPTFKEQVLKSFAEAEKAAGSTDLPQEETKEEAKVDDKPTKETKADESTEETEELEIDASPSEIQNALALFRALGDPKTASKTIQDLAKLGGYDLTKPAEVKQLAKDTKSVLKEKLGDSYDILGGDRLAEAMDMIIAEQVESKTKPTLERIAQSEREANERRANAAMDEMWARHKISDSKERERISGLMLAKMKQMPAGPESDVKSYLDDIYALATRDTEAARTVKKTVTKIKTNAEEVQRTSGEGDGVQETRVKTGSRLPSVREAVEAAFRGERFED